MLRRRVNAPSSVRSSRARWFATPAPVELRTDFNYRPRRRINFVGFAHIALSICDQLTASLRPRPKKASIAEFTALGRSRNPRWPVSAISR
jgi:hypothetical protein